MLLLQSVDTSNLQLSLYIRASDHIYMVMKVVIITLLSLLLLLTNGASLNTHHQLQAASHDLAYGPRKLMVNLKVEGFENKDLVAYDEQKKVQSGEWHDEMGGVAASKESSSSSRLFTMDYSPVRRRRPVHNKSLPTTINSP